MAYSLEDYNNCFRSYVANHPDLRREDRVRLYAFLDQLRTASDSFRNDPGRRLAPGSTRFWFDPVFADHSGRLRHFRIAVDDASAVYGVLRIVYVDEATPLG
jgi:hypothetical protein